MARPATAPRLPPRRGWSNPRPAPNAALCPNTAPARRLPGIDLPTVAEAGYPGFEVTSWYAIFGPAGIPAEVTGKLSSAIHQAVTATDLRERLKGLGTTPIGSTPEELAAYQHSDIERWTKVVRTANIRPE